MHHVIRSGSSARLVGLLALVAATVVSLLPAAADAAPSGTGADARSVAEYWTQARMDAAVPRDLVVDGAGQGYLRRPDGTLQPYGAGAAAQPAAKPSNPGGGGGGGGSDTTAPVVGSTTPADGATVTTSPFVFEAAVTDDSSGVKSVTFHVTPPGATTSTAHTATLTSGDSLSGTWTASVELPTDGDSSWTIEARDNARKGGNVATTEPLTFTVTTDGGGEEPTDPGTVVTNAEWTGGGTVQTAAGRIYFEMPGRGPFWSGYVCSGTVATDAADNTRSTILTAAHCVYDEDNDVFARNVLFIPNQAGTQASGTNTTCSDDPLGCWAPSHGVVHGQWANRSWPDNIPWDHAYYVVATEGAHTPGFGGGTEASLELAAGSLAPQFTAADQGVFTHALGYSYDEDPKFMYCAENLGTDASYNSLWLGHCGLSGGASGGPWLQPVNEGNGPIVGVNSYGYSNSPGMGSASLATGSAGCLFTVAATSSEGTVSSC